MKQGKENKVPLVKKVQYHECEMMISQFKDLSLEQKITPQKHDYFLSPVKHTGANQETQTVEAYHSQQTEFSHLEAMSGAQLKILIEECVRESVNKNFLKISETLLAYDF